MGIKKAKTKEVKRLTPADLGGGEVPAIALTAYAHSEDSERSLAAGFQVHLAKPVDIDELLTTVARPPAVFFVLVKPRTTQNPMKSTRTNTVLDASP